MRLRHCWQALLLFFFLNSPSLTRAQGVPSPESHLGYQPGADFHLARWEQVVDYFRKVDAASDRVTVRELGKTTEGRSYIVAIVSSADTIGKLDVYRHIQRRLADPRIAPQAGEPVDPVEAGKPVVLITCSIHSTETASTLMTMELLYELAGKVDAATREILDHTILLLVPSSNPDGVEKVAVWYDRSKGQPWEGSGMPWLYHKYAGHDTNRDWFMLNLRETQLLTHLLYKEWFPTTTYDVHQMGSREARIFVPPFFDPTNSNVDPRLRQSITLVGSHMAADLTAAGKKGVLTYAMYDNFWNGGNRTTPQRHNMVGVLTEAASVRMASPIFLEKDQLRADSRGFTKYQPSVNFVDPWPGGWWRLRDILEYELICSKSVLTLAARYKNDFQMSYQAMSRTAIEKGKAEPPFAWVVPADQLDPGRAVEMVRILHETGIEVQRALEPFQAGGATYSAGSWILPAAQPYRPHLKDMMERQVYPAQFRADGNPEAPYDVTGWTLPLLMGVKSVSLDEPFEAKVETPDQIEPARGTILGLATPAYYVLRNQANDDFIVVNALLSAGVELELFDRQTVMGKDAHEMPAGAIRFAADLKSKKALDAILPTVSTQVLGVSEEVRPKDKLACNPTRIRRQRIGVYRPWDPSMDEGWTRLVLEKFHFPYVTLHNAEIRAGDLKNRIDTLLIASMDDKTLHEGFAPNMTEPAYVGGLDQEGVDAIRNFVEDGGTLVCLENSCVFAIDALKLPVKNVLKRLPTSQFFAPGAIVRIRLPDEDEKADLLTAGMPDEASAFFDQSLAFEVEKDAPETFVAAHYASENPLESGWLIGPEKLEGKAAIVRVGVDDGKVILFGFPPQHRGQTHGTFRLLFNALLGGGAPAPRQGR